MAKLREGNPEISFDGGLRIKAIGQKTGMGSSIRLLEVAKHIPQESMQTVGREVKIYYFYCGLIEVYTNKPCVHLQCINSIYLIRIKKQMKKILSLVLFCTAIVFTSCKKDTPVDYPASIESGVWTGTNASTGYICDIIFAVGGSTGQHCTLVITGPGEDSKNVGSVSGQFKYNAETGTVNVEFEVIEGAPSGAVLQFDEDGQSLNVSLVGTGDYGTYTVSKATYPASIAGIWSVSGSGMTVTADLFHYAIDGGMPGLIKVLAGSYPMVLDILYAYDSKTGKGTFKYSLAGVNHTGTFEYSPIADTLTVVAADVLGENPLVLTRK